MAEGDGSVNSRRVSNESILTEIKYIQRDIGSLDTKFQKFEERFRDIPHQVETLEKEQGKLRVKSDGWNVLNSLGVFIAGIIAVITGK